jgi:hypothetical protein
MAERIAILGGGMTMGTARCIGRVGALAVALGIGIALVTMPSGIGLPHTTGPQ